MRIIAGDFGGRRLLAPRGLGTRPTSDRVKQAVFNILGAPERREGAARFRVLDLFSGSGALSLEALSRGADEAVLVDEDREAVRAAERNAELLGLRGRVRILQSEVGRALRGLEGTFDWIFLDPPYDKPHSDAGHAEEAPPRLDSEAARRRGGGRPPSSFGALDRALRLLGRGRLVAGLVIAEHDSRTPPAERYDRLVLVDRRRWGGTSVSFYRAAPDEAAAGATE